MLVGLDKRKEIIAEGGVCRNNRRENMIIGGVCWPICAVSVCKLDVLFYKGFGGGPVKGDVAEKGAERSTILAFTLGAGPWLEVELA